MYRVPRCARMDACILVNLPVGLIRRGDAERSILGVQDRTRTSRQETGRPSPGRTISFYCWSMMTKAIHKTLPCGIESGILPLPQRHIVAFQIRMLTGACSEPADKLGLARLLGESIDKGTENYSGRELSDAFDAIGASHGGGVGRETTTLTCTVLKEHFETALKLHAEFLRRPTFPNDAFEVNVELAKQELSALDDDAAGLADKYIGQKAYGPILGRNTLGEMDTLERITREDMVQHWNERFCAGRMIVSVAGDIEAGFAADCLQREFDGFGTSTPQGRECFPVEFTPGRWHHHKELEQEQIGICWQGVSATDDDFATQQMVLGVLSGGMSARLFTEVREKLALVYWVNAWHETPRGSGMVFLGASTTPQRCDKTYEALLREVNRLADDIEPDEVERALTGILAGRETRGDSTRAQCAELASDLFYFGRLRPEEEKIARFRSVTIDDIRRYLEAHPRDPLCVLTLGPRALGEKSAGDAQELKTAPNPS